MIKKIRHIGIIPKDFSATIKRFEGYGLNCNEIIKKEEDGLALRQRNRRFIHSRLRQ